MKHLRLTSLLFFTIAMIFASCDKNKTDLPVEFKFVLLDTLGNEKTVFNQGENIIFSFQLINNSSEDLMLENFFPNDEFFRVYQSNTNDGTLDYGIPYDGFVKIGYFDIPANDMLKIEYPWKGNADILEYWIVFSNINNSDLPRANYYTEFSQSFKIGDIQTEEKHFKINFTVK